VLPARRGAFVKDRQRDIELIERVRNSDRDAFRILFENYQPLVLRQVLFQTRDADASHDIVQFRRWGGDSK